MKKAKLPNGIIMHFPESISQEEMDATVKDYIRNKDSGVQKYLLNNEAMESMIALSKGILQAVDKLNKLMIESQQRQEKMVSNLNDAVKSLADAVGKDADADGKLKKSIDVFANLYHKSSGQIIESIDGLAKTIKRPIKFTRGKDGVLEGAE